MTSNHQLYWTYEVFVSPKEYTCQGIGTIIGLILGIFIGTATFALPSEIGNMTWPAGQLVSGATGFWNSTPSSGRSSGVVRSKNVFGSLARGSGEAVV